MVIFTNEKKNVIMKDETFYPKDFVLQLNCY